jgi:hypothetical protein
MAIAARNFRRVGINGIIKIPPRPRANPLIFAVMLYGLRRAGQNCS